MKRLLIVVLVLAAIFVGVGVSQDWFNYDAQAKSFSFDTDAMKGSWNKLKDKAKSISKSAVDLVKGKGKKVSETEQVIDGKLVAIDAANQIVTIEVAGTDIELPYLGDVDLAALEGKNVTVKVETTEDGVVLRGIEEKK